MQAIKGRRRRRPGDNKVAPAMRHSARGGPCVKPRPGLPFLALRVGGARQGTPTRPGGPPGLFPGLGGGEGKEKGKR